MSKIQPNLLLVVLLCAIVLAVLGCTTVSVPPYEQDKPPIITIDGIPRFQSGKIDKPEIKSTSTAYVTLGTQLQITGNAYNPVGGVKSFSLTVRKGDSIMYSVQTTSSPDTNNKVPTQLVILGSDGAAGPGNIPIVIDMSETGIGLAKLTASATNYNGMSTSVEITYIRLGPIAISFKADPESINSGQHSTLTWVVNNATSVNISPQLPISPLPISGSADVFPTQTTTYTLTAKNPFETLSKDRWVTVGTTTPPQPPAVQTTRINLQAQPMGPQGGYQPFVYTFMGYVSLQQIELPTDAGNTWVAAIKLPKLGYTTDSCGDATKYVLLLPGSRTTPQQMKEIYGSETPPIAPGGRIVACVSPKPGAAIGSSVGVLITYTD